MRRASAPGVVVPVDGVVVPPASGGGDARKFGNFAITSHTPSTRTTAPAATQIQNGRFDGGGGGNDPGAGGVWAMTVQQNRIKFENHKSVMRAFEHYDRSLAAFLRICVNGTALVDCDAR